MKSTFNHDAENEYVIGPGTDLLLGLFIVMLLVAGYYVQGKQTLESEVWGKFRLSDSRFSAADFKSFPVDAFVDGEEAKARAESIIGEYRKLAGSFPYIYVVGHANRLDKVGASDQRISDRKQRNWNYAGRRAAVTAGMLVELLGENEQDRVVVVSAGEQDLLRPDQPYSPDNAWVEVVFGKEWKLPSSEMSEADLGKASAER